MDPRRVFVYDLKTRSSSRTRAQAADGLTSAPDDDHDQPAHREFRGPLFAPATTLHQPIEEGAKSVPLCHLGHIAQWTVARFRVDPATGHIQGDDAAMAYWQRSTRRVGLQSLNPDRFFDPRSSIGASARAL